MLSRARQSAFLGWVLLAARCAGSPEPAAQNRALDPASTPSRYDIVTFDGHRLQGVTVGDALKLKVVSVMADGAAKDLPFEAAVAWSVPTVSALAPEEDTDGILPAAQT